MINVNCLNNIASVGLDLFSSDYNANAAFEEADAVLVRSAKMHDMESLYLIHQVLMLMRLRNTFLQLYF